MPSRKRMNLYVWEGVLSAEMESYEPDGCGHHARYLASRPPVPAKPRRRAFPVFLADVLADFAGWLLSRPKGTAR